MSRSDITGRSMMPRSRAMLQLVKSDWSSFKDLCNKRWKSICKEVLPASYSSKSILGSGYFGVVFETNHKKLVMKITSDPDEGYFNKIVLTDLYLRTNPGLPYVFDCFSIPEWDAYVILRENVHYGLGSLPKSAPLARAIKPLDEFGEESMRIEARIAQLLEAQYELNDAFSKKDFTYAFREAQGQIRGLIVRALKTLPEVSPRSKYHASMSVIRHSLDKYGIALWDLHSGNLGRHKFDMQDLAPNAPPLDKDTVLILDVGGNFGSPIMTDSIESFDI
ncbi:MAG: hypothetical protein ACXAEN_13445 [Candidatus Thorarchaeota archaeon]